MIPSFFAIRTFDTIDSTSTVAKQAAQEGAPEGLVIRALSQTAGKGRQGRPWISPKGNLYLSVLLRPNCTPQQAGHFSFATALAVFNAIAEVHSDEKLSLKWPNDVLLGGAKISGILLDISADGADKVEWLVAGIGINVAHAPEVDQTAYPTTSLSAQGCTVDPDVLFEAFLRSFHHWILTLRHDGFDPIRRAWLTDAHRGPMAIRLPQSEINGNFAGMDPDGGLILRLVDGSERVVHAGDVFLM
ncbi:MAG: biotin--[acetyl-CoA-carboxylase] ligase [Bdellovibrionales bacterium]